jgi:bifunctional non-homologous end joining protein LigD
MTYRGGADQVAQKSSERVGGIPVELSHLEKVLFPGDDISKGDLVAYYERMAPRIIRYLRDRPLVMERYPDGIAGQRLVQKNVPGYFPDWVTRTEVKKQDGVVRHVVCDKPATLVYLANQACIELHVFLSGLAALDRPDQLLFDLDPPDDAGFGQACRHALNLRELLEGELGLAAFVKTTGGRGLHVHVPLRAERDFDAVRGFAREAATLLVSRFPRELTLEQRKEQRGQRLYLDVMRNAYAQTVIAPYAVRARLGAPVATPLHWAEVEDGGLAPRRFTLRTLARELEGRGDPWAGMARHRRGLPDQLPRLRGG